MADDERRDAPDAVDALDPELASLVDGFVRRLPDRVAALKESLERGDLAALAGFAHQLKGSAGGYGFPDITTAAGALEESVERHEALDTVRVHVQQIAALCRDVERARRSR